jgi:hypothetical protein
MARRSPPAEGAAGAPPASSCGAARRASLLRLGRHLQHICSRRFPQSCATARSRNIAATGAAVVATGNIGCITQIVKKTRVRKAVAGKTLARKGARKSAPKKPARKAPARKAAARPAVRHAVAAKRKTPARSLARRAVARAAAAGRRAPRRLAEAALRADIRDVLQETAALFAVGSSPADQIEWADWPLGETLDDGRALSPALLRDLLAAEVERMRVGMAAQTWIERGFAAAAARLQEMAAADRDDA